MNASIKHGIPEGQYYGDKTRWSATLLKSAAYGGLGAAKKILEGVDIDSKAMREGRLAHLAVCCPKEWDELVVYPPEDLKEGVLDSRGNVPAIPERTKQYSERVEKWKKACPDKMHVTKREHDNALKYHAALVNSPCWSEPTNHEIVAHFEFEGRPYKARIDAERNNGDGSYTLYDWKFIGGRTGTEDFADKVELYNYYMQASLYRYAYQQAGRVVSDFILVGVDKRTCDPAHTVCLAVSDQKFEEGINDCRLWHHRIEAAQAFDYWENPEE